MNEVHIYAAAAVGALLGAYAFDSVGRGILCAIGAAIAAALWRLDRRVTGQ